jgi:hypothetical protein
LSFIIRKIIPVSPRGVKWNLGLYKKGKCNPRETEKALSADYADFADFKPGSLLFKT